MANHSNFKLKFLVVAISLNLASIAAQAEDSLDAAIQAARDRSDNNSTAWFNELKDEVLNHSPEADDSVANLDRQGSNQQREITGERLELAKENVNQKHQYQFDLFAVSALDSKEQAGDIEYYAKENEDKTNYKKLYDVLNYAQTSYDSKDKKYHRADSYLKKEYNRGRPWDVVDDNGEYKPDFKSMSGSSFPSGHTWDGYREAAIWSMIFPERGQEIFSRALQYGESRTIVGAHFPTDTIASRAGNYFYLAKLLEDDASTEAIVEMAKKIRTEANPSCTDGQNLQTCLLQKQNPITDGYAESNNEIGYYGLITDSSADSRVNVSDLNPIAANLLRIRYPYLSDAQRLETLAGTAYAKNSIAAKVADQNWGLIDLPKAYTGPARIDSDWSVTQDYNEKRDVSGFGQYDEWRNNISGSGKLTKSGAGTLALTGDNSFAGFDLNSGILELKGSNTLSNTSTVNDGVLNLASGGELSSALAVTGGEVNLLAGSLVDGDTSINQGTLNVNSDASIQNERLSVNGGTLNIAKNSSISSNDILLENGHINIAPHDLSTTSIPTSTNLTGNIVARNSQINLANGVAGDKLTINGNFSTGNNTWLMDSYLTGLGQSDNLGSDGKSYTDTVKITGDVLDNGKDWVKVENLNIKEPTGQESILMYDIDGASNGKFALQKRVAKGGYEYLLNKHADGDWYLESNNTTPEAAFDAAIERALNRSDRDSQTWYNELKQDVINKSPVSNDTLAELDRQGSINKLLLNNSEKPEDVQRVELAYADESRKPDYKFNTFSTVALGKSDVNIDYHGDYDPNGRTDYDENNRSSYDRVSDIITKAKYIGKYEADYLLKKDYNRARPFSVIDFDNPEFPYLNNYKDIEGNQSFPSGHTWTGFKTAAIWSSIFPERGQEIFSRALQYGESRVILGKHFPTDTIASRAGNYYYLSKVLEDEDTAKTMVALAKDIREKAKIDCADEQNLQSCLFDKANPITDAYAESNDEIGYYGKIYDDTADSHVVPSDLPEVSANLLRLRFPYLTNEQRLDILVATAYPKNSIAAKAVDGNWGLINLPKAYAGPVQINGNLQVNQDTQADLDIAGFGQYDEWRNNISGSGKLTKSGAGTLALTGDNSFAGFDLNSGILELKGSNTLSNTSTVNDGILNLSSGGELSSALAVTGGEVNLLAGSLVEGDTSINQGKLNVNSDASIQNERLSVNGGTLNIASNGVVNSENITLNNGRLNIAPISASQHSTNTSRAASINNAPRRLPRALPTSPATVTIGGNITAKNSQISLANNKAGDKLTINGNYTADGNTWLLDSHLTGLGQSDNLGVDGKSYTDNINIKGNVIDNGIDWVWIDNLNVADPTGEESVLLYDIEGDSNGKFLLQRRIAKGGYEYLLNKHADGDWYLESLSLTGAKGETGDKGPTGDQGSKGETGDKGPTGDQGSKGETGDKGPTGDQGNKGETGDKGPTGDQGNKGETGDKGPTGDQGNKGETGDKGPTGDQGNKGETGDKGPTGDQGSKGETGDKGPTGDQGKTDIHTPVIRPEVGSYLTNANMGNNLFVHRLEDRESASRYDDQNSNDVGQLWIRAVGGTHEFDDKSGQINTDGHNYLVHGGMGIANFGNNDEFNVGVMAAYGNAESDSQSSITKYKSSAKINGYGLGLYGTWYQNPNDRTGAYANAWAMWNKFDNKVSGQDFETVEYDSSGVIASIEAGASYPLAQSQQGTSYWIQPQGQLIYQNVQQDDFKESTTGTQIGKGKANIQTRLGAKAYMNVPTDITQSSSYRPFVALNWIHNTAADEQVRLDNTYYGTGGNSNIGEVKVGLEGQSSKNSHASIDVSYQQGSDYNNMMGSIGWKFKF